jgi:serine/threonine-protein kinase RsbW
MNSPFCSSTRTTLKTELACEFGRVRTTAELVRSFLKEHGCDDETRLDCELALVEGCNNAIKYADPNATREPVLLEINLGQNEIELRITDHGPGFAWPESVELPGPENESGRGLYLIRVLMDYVTYLRGAKQNTLVLRKRRAG